MRTVKSYLNKQLEKAYNNQIDFPIDNKLINVVYVGNDYDYSIRSLIPVSKILEKNSIKKSPQDLFHILSTGINFEHFETIFDRNGLHINLKTNLIIDLIKSKAFLNLEIDLLKRNILVDYSSPNIAKDMHVGHLRSTIIGDSICNLFETLGHVVYRVNHIGDFGTQFGMIIQHLLEIHPDYENSDLNIADLQTFYAQSKKRFDLEEDFKVAAYNKVVLLQQGDEEIVRAWNFIKDISRESYEEIYKRLDIKELQEVGESFYQPFIPELIVELEASGLLIEDDGRKIIRVEGYEVPLTVVKSDGGYTYDTTDLAAVKYRLTTLKMDKIIYVTDVGQEPHFNMIFKVAEMIGWKKYGQELVHVGFGLVLGPDGKKLKSRAGDTIKLMELLDEGLEKAKEVLEEQQKIREERDEERKMNLSEDEKTNIIQRVAYGSIKYADLASTRTNNYKFSFDKMINLKGNTAAYQQYQYVRIAAILRNADAFIQDIDISEFTISEPEEISICKLLLVFPEIIEKMSDDLMFHTLCSYMYDLTNAFSTFHLKCRCLEFNEEKEIIGVHKSRLMICQFTKTVLEKCFDILGINKLEKM